MRALLVATLLALASAQMKPLDPAFTAIWGIPPGLETRNANNRYNQQLLEIYGPPPKTRSGSDNDKRQVLAIYGRPPSTPRPISDSDRQEVLDIFGPAPTLEPIDSLELPEDVWGKLFGFDDNKITDNEEENTRFNPDAASDTSPMSESPVTSTVSVTSIRPETLRSNLTVYPNSLQVEIDNVFGRAPGLETIEVKPTVAPATFLGEDGAPCQCVPYYLCDKDQNGVYINNASETGYGMLDIRFGEPDNPSAPKITRKCQESVELCCTVPKEPETVTQPPVEPKLKGCGYRNPKGIDITITGNGGEAQYGEFPWVVALIDSTNGSLIGVGSLIHPQVVITGAHVASRIPLSNLIARAGEWDTSTVKERFPYQERQVEEIYNHFDFHPKSLRNDVALLRLSKPFKLAKHINMICLPNQDESFDTSVNCTANGWGKDVFGVKGRYAVILKKVSINMVPYGRCSSQLKNTRLGPNFVLHQSFVCAGGEEGKDTCTGDGGAPLSCPLGDDRYKLTGMVAWGIGCGKKDVPAVYAGVSNFRTLIDDKMNEWGYGTTTYSI